MILKSFTDYGLRMLMRMASAPDQAFSTADLAKEFKLSRNHLAKIVQRLAQGDIIETRRGVNGGAVLRSGPSEIRLGDVVRLLEQGQVLVECFGRDGGKCTMSGCCSLKSRLQQAESHFIEELNRSTLADIAFPTRAAA